MTDYDEWQQARGRVREFLTVFGEQPGGMITGIKPMGQETIRLLWDDLALLVRSVPLSRTHNPADANLGSDDQVRSELAELRDHLSMGEESDAADVVAVAKASMREAEEKAVSQFDEAIRDARQEYRPEKQQALSVLAQALALREGFAEIAAALPSMGGAQLREGDIVKVVVEGRFSSERVGYVHPDGRELTIVVTERLWGDL